MRAILINLARDSARLRAAARDLRALGVRFERLDAVDGHALGEAEFRAFTALRPRGGDPWLRGQVGCLLSHREAWKMIAASPEPAGAVLEDDLLLSPGFADPLADSGWIPPDADVVRLECASNRVLLDGDGAREVFGRTLAPLRSTAWCAGAYVLRREVARRLLDLPPEGENSVDTQLFSHEHSRLARALRTFQFTPGYCIQRKDAGVAGPGWESNIDVAPHPLSHVLKDAFRRFGPGSVYRSLAGYRRVPFR